eukprot:tig00020961_g16741.t1
MSIPPEVLLFLSPMAMQPVAPALDVEAPAVTWDDCLSESMISPRSVSSFQSSALTTSDQSGPSSPCLSADVATPMSEADTLVDEENLHESFFVEPEHEAVAVTWQAPRVEDLMLPIDLEANLHEEADHPAPKRRKIDLDETLIENEEPLSPEYDEEVLAEAPAFAPFAETSEEEHLEKLGQLRADIGKLDAAAAAVFREAFYRMAAASEPADGAAPLPAELEIQVNAAVAVQNAAGRRRKGSAFAQKASEEMGNSFERMDRLVLRLAYLVDTENPPAFVPPAPPAEASPPPQPAAPPAEAAAQQIAGGQQPAQKKRVFFSEAQTAKLNHYFEASVHSGNKVTPQEISAIALDVGITEHQVRIYFQNKRARSRGKPSSSSRPHSAASSPCSSAASSPLPAAFALRSPAGAFSGPTLAASAFRAVPVRSA